MFYHILFFLAIVAFFVYLARATRWTLRTHIVPKGARIIH